MTEHKTPVDHALDLFLYAPLGLAFTAAEELPKLVEKGRERARMYQMIGQFAVSQGQQQAQRFVKGAGERVSGRPPTAAPPARSASAPRPGASTSSTSPATTSMASSAPAQSAPGPSARVGGNGNGQRPVASSAPTAPAAPASAPASGTPATAPGSGGWAPTSDQLAIPGYDALSASQVVQRLAGLSADELESVRAYEAASRGRTTILSRVAQLQLGS